MKLPLCYSLSTKKIFVQLDLIEIITAINGVVLKLIFNFLFITLKICLTKKICSVRSLLNLLHLFSCQQNLFPLLHLIFLSQYSPITVRFRCREHLNSCPLFFATKQTKHLKKSITLCCGVRLVKYVKSGRTEKLAEPLNLSL